VKCEWCEEKCF